MTREAEARLKLTAQDKTGKAFASVAGRFGTVARQAAMFNQQAMVMGKSVRHLDRGFMAMSARAAGFFTPLVVGAGITAATKKFATLERELQRMVITGEATDDQIGVIKDRIEEVAQVAALPVQNVRDGFMALLNAGKTVEEALRLLESTSIAAQASDSEVADLSNTIIAVGDNLGILAEKSQGAFDIMIKGGKLGKFELKDMAQHLPGLVPQFANLGLKGEEGLKQLVAMLQVVRPQTGDAGQAATALSDLFQKMEVDTVQNKFKKFGIDVRASLSRARREGKELVEVFLDLSQQATGGDLSKLAQLIPDKEMRRAVQALLQQRDLFRQYRKDLDSSAGESMRDLKRLTNDTQASIDKLSNSWGRMVTNLGALAAKPLAPAMETIADLLDPNTYKMLEDDPAIAAALKRGATTSGLSEKQIEAIRGKRAELSKDVADIEGKGEKMSGRESLMLPGMKELLADWQDLVDRIEKNGPDGTQFDFLPPIIQPGKASAFPEDPAQKYEHPIPRGKPEERLRIGLPKEKPAMRPDGLHLGAASGAPRLPVDMPPRTRSDTPFLDIPAPRQDFQFLKPMSLDTGDATREAQQAFDEIERAADMDLSAAGDKAMGSFKSGFSQQSAAMIAEVQAVRKRIESIMGAPIRANVAVNGARANVGRSMPHIEAE